MPSREKLIEKKKYLILSHYRPTFTSWGYSVFWWMTDVLWSDSHLKVGVSIPLSNAFILIEWKVLLLFYFQSKTKKAKNPC